MKRSSNINKSTFDKVRATLPFVFFGGIFAYSVYEPKTEGYIFKDDEHCKNSNPEMAEQCDIAYQDALARAELNAPKYSSSQSCQSEFSDDCYYSSSYNSYIPRMNSFFYTNDLSGLKQTQKTYFSEPLYRYRSGYYSGSGTSYGTKIGQSMSMNTDSIKSSSGTIGKVMSRGGFGQSISRSLGG
ncbi:DUF1190 domain-containing protein [Vibrio mimicus]|uniref:DUF1190 domain-containing protein n=1 Tax=Vibrio mimicus TaxID=674 RepID=UPI0012AC790B|nr:DUF1190 domain-containing protein [Vibrio mimicus]